MSVNHDRTAQVIENAGLELEAVVLKAKEMEARLAEVEAGHATYSELVRFSSAAPESRRDDIVNHMTEQCVGMAGMFWFLEERGLRGRYDRQNRASKDWNFKMRLPAGVVLGFIEDHKDGADRQRVYATRPIFAKPPAEEASTLTTSKGKKSWEGITNAISHLASF